MRPISKETPDWAVTGAVGREPRSLSSIYIDPVDEEVTNIRLLRRWMEIEKNEVRYKELYTEDAEILVIGFGTAGRVASSAVKQARQEGIKAGLFRPITLAPFPMDKIETLSKRVKRMLVVEMNTGMMLEDIQKIVQGRVPVEFFGRLGGVTPFPDEILDEIRRVAQNEAPMNGHAREEWLDRLEKIVEGGR